MFLHKKSFYIRKVESIDIIFWIATFYKQNNDVYETYNLCVFC